MPSLNDIEYSRTRKSEVRWRPGAKKSPRRVQTVRMLAAQTEWLEGPLRWHEGRVQWVHSRGLLSPTPADLSAAQRALYHVAHYPHASDRAFGDGAAWLAKRQVQLEQAKRLYLLRVPDLAALIADRSPEALSRLVELLAAEALCLNALPASPSRALVRAASSAPAVVVRLLQELIADERLPLAVRALASATFGAVMRGTGNLASGAQNLESRILGRDAALNQAYRWGARSGPLPEPGLAIKILLDGSPELLERWQTAQNMAQNCALPCDSLQTMLTAGTEPERLVALCESVVEAQCLIRHLNCYILAEMDEMAIRFEFHPEHLQAWRHNWRRRCHEINTSLASMVQHAALTTANPEAPRLMAAFIVQMLKLHDECTRYTLDLPRTSAQRRRKRRCRTNNFESPGLVISSLQRAEAAASLRVMEILWQAALQALREGQALTPALLVPYLGLLVEERNLCWTPKSLVWGCKDRDLDDRIGHLVAWLRQGCERNVRPVVSLLKRSRDPGLCRAALRAGAHVKLGAIRFQDFALYGYALHLTKLLEPFHFNSLEDLYEYLQHFATASEARSALGPVIEAVGVLPRELRSDALNDVLTLAGNTRGAITSTLPRIAPHLKYLFELLVRTQRTGQVYGAVEALLALDGEARYRKRTLMVEDDSERAESDDESPLCGEAESGDGLSTAELYDAKKQDGDEVPPFDYWLTWLLDETHLVQRERRAAKRSQHLDLGLLTRLCMQLADGDFALFQRSLYVTARYNLWDTTGIEQGLDELRRYPRLRSLLAESLSIHPGRVLKLIARLAHVRRLGAHAVRPLDVWRAKNDFEAKPRNKLLDIPGEWSETVALAPEIVPLAQEYVWLQQIRDEAIGVPAGVRRALELPFKLQVELGHLEKLLSLHPDRAGLSQRASTLRLRIQDQDTLQAQAIQEACERLRGAIQQARLEAAECSLANCFRVLLESLVGRLPCEPTMDDDWSNAVLLSVDIDCNRKLLRNMLRALANNEAGWREQLPGNVAFLREIAERGINVEAWKRTHRKRYRHAALPGGWVHLCIEQDPLKVLQMGNAFGTCLSVGGCNSFSTVANACEANKRVIFARDGSGRIVARKLLAVNAAGALVGFHTYTGGPNEKINAPLRAIVGRYARNFAAKCGLELADEGDVPVLFAQEWYDDGIVPWSLSEAKSKISSSGRISFYQERRRAPSSTRHGSITGRASSGFQEESSYGRKNSERHFAPFTETPGF